MAGLSQSRRSQLDAIVMRMAEANASDEEVRAVVEDFKSKYSDKEPRNGLRTAIDTASSLLGLGLKPANIAKGAKHQWEDPNSFLNTSALDPIMPKSERGAVRSANKAIAGLATPKNALIAAGTMLLPPAAAAGVGALFGTQAVSHALSDDSELTPEEKAAVQQSKQSRTSPLLDALISGDRRRLDSEFGKTVRDYEPDSEELQRLRGIAEEEQTDKALSAGMAAAIGGPGAKAVAKGRAKLAKPKETKVSSESAKPTPIPPPLELLGNAPPLPIDSPARRPVRPALKGVKGTKKTDVDVNETPAIIREVLGDLPLNSFPVEYTPEMIPGQPIKPPIAPSRKPVQAPLEPPPAPPVVEPPPAPLLADILDSLTVGGRTPITSKRGGALKGKFASGEVNTFPLNPEPASVAAEAWLKEGGPVPKTEGITKSAEASAKTLEKVGERPSILDFIAPDAALDTLPRVTPRADVLKGNKNKGVTLGSGFGFIDDILGRFKSKPENIKAKQEPEVVPSVVDRISKLISTYEQKGDFDTPLKLGLYDKLQMANDKQAGKGKNEGVTLGSGPFQAIYEKVFPASKEKDIPIDTTHPGAAYLVAEAAELTRRKNPGYVERIRKWTGDLTDLQQGFHQKFVDSTSPIPKRQRELEKEHGYITPPKQDMRYYMDRVQHASSVTEQTLNNIGLIKTIREVPHFDLFRKYLNMKQMKDVEIAHMGAKGYADALARGEEGKIYGKPLREMESALEYAAKNPTLQKAWGPYEGNVRKAETFLRHFMVKSGLISQEMATHLATIYPNYVPTKRIMEALDGRMPSGRPASSVQPASITKQTGVKKIKGGKQMVDDPFEGMIEKYHTVIAEGLRNQSATELINLAHGPNPMPGWGELIKPLAENEIRNVDPKNTVSRLVNGKREVFEVPHDVAVAARSLEAWDQGPILRYIAMPMARALKLGSTGIELAFPTGNIVRDFVQAFTDSLSPRKLNLSKPHTLPAQLAGATKDYALNLGSAMKSAVLHDKDWNDLVIGGGGSTSNVMHRSNPMSTVKGLRTLSTPGRASIYAINPVNYLRHVKHGVELTENTIARSEEVGRITVYRNTLQRHIREGMPKGDAKIMAVIEANNAMPNYRHSGTLMRAYQASVPYLGPRIQGAQSSFRAMKRAPMSVATKVALTIMAPVIGATLHNLSDPKRREAYFDTFESDKESNLLIYPDEPIKNAKGEYGVYKSPIPQSYAPLATFGRHLMEQVFTLYPEVFMQMAKLYTPSKVDTENTSTSIPIPALETKKDFIDPLIGMFSPVQPNMRSLMSNGIPQAARWFGETYADYDYFRDRPITDAYLKNIESPSLRYKENTPQIAIDIGRIFNIAPVSVESGVNRALGGIGPQLMHYTDKARKALGADIPDSHVGGRSIPEAISRRFTRVHGGAADTNVRKAQASVADKATVAGYAELSKPVKAEFERLRIAPPSIERKSFESDTEYALRLKVKAKIINEAVEDLLNNDADYKGYLDKYKKEYIQDVLGEFLADLNSLSSDPVYEQSTPKERIGMIEDLL